MSKYEGVERLQNTVPSSRRLEQNSSFCSVWRTNPSSSLWKNGLIRKHYAVGDFDSIIRIPQKCLRKERFLMTANFYRLSPKFLNRVFRALMSGTVETGRLPELRLLNRMQDEFRGESFLPVHHLPGSDAIGWYKRKVNLDTLNWTGSLLEYKSAISGYFFDS